MNDEERKLTELSRVWMQAIATNEVAAIEPFMSEEWVLVTPQAGPVQREQFLGSIASGALVHHDMVTVGEPLVRIYGDGAVMVSHVQNRGSFQGQPFSFDEWSTDYYVRDGDTWRCVVTALTPNESQPN